MNPTEFSVLELLYHRGKQPIQLIRKKVLIASSSTYVIDKLSEKKFVVRKEFPKDRRASFIELTDKGPLLMEIILPEHEKKINEVFKGLDAAELSVMIKILKKIDCNAQEI